MIVFTTNPVRSFCLNRRLCGLPPIETFADLAGYMTNTTVANYAQLYSSVDDIDLWSAGVSERPLSGSLLGPTFSCIIGLQMQRLRQGDRFWYELPGQPSSFTPRQLEAIRRVQLSRLLCDNTDNIETLQMYPFVLQDPRINPRVSCRSGVIPRLDLSAWQEPPPTPLLPQVVPVPSNRPKSISSVRHQAYFYAFGL
ncbi:peroxidase skpo-1-like [Penaeus vannamei]|uniref:peroxidase skpo-1-like n=1 Tax=Penaeus vannamei TaxID=6689 RepID=UPI00387F7C4C